MSGLRSCPFCGGEQVFTAEGEDGWVHSEHSCDFVECESFPTEAEAIAAWNTRAERTCKLDYERHCSNCGVHVHKSAVLVRKDLDGGAWTVVSKPANYCPMCGAKVVKE